MRGSDARNRLNHSERDSLCSRGRWRTAWPVCIDFWKSGDWSKTVKGILADNNVIGQVAYLVRLMQAKPWDEFWNELGLVVCQFADVGLLPTASDVEVWQRCQAHELILITDNRNEDSPDSLTAAIRKFNTSTSLPVFTIADLDKFKTSREYDEQVVVALYDYLLRIDEVRGTGRLFLP